jgi:pimeloyl-ACP methyl ester carboxylesterase
MLQGADLQHPPMLWNQFDALRRVPLMIIRGANSDLLAPTTLETMLSRRDPLEVAIVPDQGHAPLLAEAKLIRRIFRPRSARQKKERSGLQFACDELIDKGAIHTGA